LKYIVLRYKLIDEILTIEELISMENRPNPAAMRPAVRYPADKTLEDLRQKVHALLDDRMASRFELLRAEWFYDLALLINDFRDDVPRGGVGR